MEVLDEFGIEHASVDGPRPAGQMDPEIAAHLDGELTAGELHHHRRAAAVEHVRHRRPAGAGARGQGLSYPAFEDPDPDLARGELAEPRHVGAVGKQLVALDLRPDARQLQRLELGGAGDADRALRVADRDVLKGPLASPGAKATSAVLGSRRVLRGADRRLAHVHPTGVGSGDARSDLARGGLDRKRVLLGPAVAVQIEDRLAGAVARELGLGPVRVEDLQPSYGVRLLGPMKHQHAVGPHPAVDVTQAPYVPGRKRERELLRLEDQVVVAQRLPLLEPHASPLCPSRSRSSRSMIFSSSTATSSAPRSVTSTSATWGSLRIHVSCRRAYWRVRRFIASASPASSSANPSALRAVGEAPAASAARTSSSAPAATMASPG